MNRAERRAARRGMGQHLDCGCKPRLLVPVERTATCPECRRVHTWQGFPMPTAADVGSLTTVYAGCSCGGELEVLCSVEVL